MRVVVTGAAGQVGREVAEHCLDRGDEVVACDRATLDVSDRLAVHGLVSAVRPDVVIHCAAWTAVDACESDPAKAHLMNGSAAQHVAEAAAIVGAHLVAVSTDYVFDGTKPAPYVESDPTNPVSVYGQSKLEGERAVLAVGGSATIARTSWVCGRYGANMVKTILRIAEQPGELRFVDDQRGHPTIAADLAVLLRRLAVERVAGVVHTTNQGPVSWFEFTQEVLAAAGHDPGRVQPVATADLHPPRPAPRPANSVLAPQALLDHGIDLLDDFRAPLRNLVAELQGKK